MTEQLALKTFLISTNPIVGVREMYRLQAINAENAAVRFVVEILATPQVFVWEVDEKYKLPGFENTYDMIPKEFHTKYVHQETGEIFDLGDFDLLVSAADENEEDAANLTYPEDFFPPPEAEPTDKKEADDQEDDDENNYFLDLDSN